MLIALGVAVVVTAWYRLTALERFANDGPQLASVFVRLPDAVHWQVLYLPLARLIGRVVTWGDPFEPLRLLSALGSGLGLAFSFVLARGLGAPRIHAALAIYAVASAPYAWFFGSTVEVHAVHFAMVGLAACVTFFAPWRRPAVALPIAALALGATWTTHGTAVWLGPGWLGLVALGRARVAEPFPLRTLLFVVGPVCLAGLLAVMVPLKTWWVATTGGSSDLEWAILVAYFRNADHLAFLVEGLLIPLALVLPGIALGLWNLSRNTATRRLAGTLALLIAPGTLFIVGWGVPEDGGYFLGHAPFHAALIAGGLAVFPVGSMRKWTPLLLYVQFMGTYLHLRQVDARFSPDDRQVLAYRVFGGSGYLGKIAYLAPEVTVWNPGVEEVELTGRLHAGFHEGLDPEAVAAAVAPTLAAVLGDRPVAIDVSYRGEEFKLVAEGFPPYVDAFVEALLARFEVEERTRGDWTFAVLRRAR